MADFTCMDYYGILGINRSATDEDIKKAYRKLALKYHPNRNPETDAGQKFAEVAEAYHVLSNPKWKVLFDQFGEEAIKIRVPVPPVGNELQGPIEVYSFHGDSMKVFRDFFGVDSPFADLYLPNLDPSYKFFEKPAQPIQGPDQEHILELSLEEAYYGCIKTVTIPLRVVDETGTRTTDEEKSFTFRVPKGTKNGHLFHFKSAGTSGPNMLPGDVTFRAEIQPHPEFWLEDANIVTSKTLRLGQALTGCTIDVTTFDGKTVHITLSDVIKPGHSTKNGHLFYFKSAGTSGPNMVPGDVTFRAEIQLHPEFWLEDANIVTSKTLRLGQALTGCTIDVTTFDGKTVHITLSDVIKPGHRITVKGGGMPIIGLATKGDFLVEFKVAFPEKLSKKQKELIREALIKKNV